MHLVIVTQCLLWKCILVHHILPCIYSFVFMFRNTFWNVWHVSLYPMPPYIYKLFGMVWWFTVGKYWGTPPTVQHLPPINSHKHLAQYRTMHWHWMTMDVDRYWYEFTNFRYPLHEMCTKINFWLANKNKSENEEHINIVPFIIMVRNSSNALTFWIL